MDIIVRDVQSVSFQLENASWTICEENRIIAKWIILNWNMNDWIRDKLIPEYS